MRMFFTVLISVLASSTATYAETLSADKIKSDIIGKIMCVDTKSGKACARHNADGTSQIISGPPQQKGKWRLENNNHCVTWEKIRNGKELCFEYIKDGNSLSAPKAGGKITFQ
ncbi:hypothetical protein [Agrobacterium salinitolerans]|uniref:hypothetical protein n=1 Tax=Agrobacterium salinitolerans TaxID=1183413 RepID=UPI0015744425|nr:hypothetical protein [Agrobacterium salinitolerans]NTA36227.1 hypothetical protein [Agrobacterium salinitolerans]